jgi:hypothetical protein
VNFQTLFSSHCCANRSRGDSVAHILQRLLFVSYTISAHLFTYSMTMAIIKSLLLSHDFNTISTYLPGTAARSALYRYRVLLFSNVPPRPWQRMCMGEYVVVRRGGSQQQNLVVEVIRLLQIQTIEFTQISLVYLDHMLLMRIIFVRRIVVLRLEI